MAQTWIGVLPESHNEARDNRQGRAAQEGMEVDMQRKMRVKADGVDLPAYAHEGDAGLDLRVNEYAFMNPDETVMAHSGVSVAVPDGCVGLVFPRSGLASKKGLRLANCVGVIDSGYRGEIMLPLHNDSNQFQMVGPGDRVAQLVVVPYVQCAIDQVDSFEDTERGADGLGSTGVE